MADQEKFHYPLPEDEGPSRWDGLSKAAREAITAKAAGENAADELLGGDEAAAIELNSDARRWAEALLPSVFTTWEQYADDQLIIPESVDQFLGMDSHIAGNITKLHKSYIELLHNCSETSLHGRPIYQAMEPVLLPWQYMLERQSDFADWIGDWRRKQGITEEIDHIPFAILSAVINDDRAIYRNPNRPDWHLKMREYLALKIKQDGPWGVMLAQISEKPGIQSLENETLDDLTAAGKEHFSLVGQNVDGMGVLEWLCLTFQKYPRFLSAAHDSWLPANRIKISSDIHPWRVPRVNWESGGRSRVEMALDYPEANLALCSPRLAIL